MSSNAIEACDPPALRIIKRFGGLTKAARAWNKSKSTVQRWKESGFIHPDYYDEILSAAVVEQVKLDPADFNLVDATHPAFSELKTASPGSTAVHAGESSPHPIPGIEQSPRLAVGPGQPAGVPARGDIAFSSSSPQSAAPVGADQDS